MVARGCCQVIFKEVGPVREILKASVKDGGAGSEVTCFRRERCTQEVTFSNLAVVGVRRMILNGPCHFGVKSPWGLLGR